MTHLLIGLGALACGTSLLLATAGAALAKPAKKAKAPASIEIVNDRKVGLTMFEIMTEGAKAKSIAKLAKPIAAGEKARISLKAASGCSFLARWTFEDAGDESTVNLCNDPKIVLTD